MVMYKSKQSTRAKWTVLRVSTFIRLAVPLYELTQTFLGGSMCGEITTQQQKCSKNTVVIRLLNEIMLKKWNHISISQKQLLKNLSKVSKVLYNRFSSKSVTVKTYSAEISPLTYLHEWLEASAGTIRARSLNIEDIKGTSDPRWYKGLGSPDSITLNGQINKDSCPFSPDKMKN